MALPWQLVRQAIGSRINGFPAFQTLIAAAPSVLSIEFNPSEIPLFFLQTTAVL